MMKSTITVVLAALLVGALLGMGIGWYRNYTTRWDLSMEDVSYFEKEAAKEQEKVEAAASGKVKAPRVQIPVIEYDFGVMELNEQTQNGSYDFIIENIGTDTLKLTEKDKSCFCTDFKIAKKSLAPGEKTTCTVTWDGHSGGGDFKQSVIIGTNDPLAPEFFFNVKGLYTSPIICNPNQVVFTGISSDQAHTREFHILGFGKTEAGEPFGLEFSEIKVSDPEHFELSVEKGTLDDMTDSERENKVFAQATSLFRGKMTVKPGLPQGSFQEVVQFKTNHPDLPVLELMVEGQVTGAVTISGTKYDKHGTGQLLIGPISSRVTTTERIRMDIVNPTLIAGPETVRVVRARPEWLKISFDYPPKEAQKALPVKIIPVTIEIPAGSPQGKFSGPGLTEMGEVVFGIGGGETPQQIVLPVNFAVGP